MSLDRKKTLAVMAIVARHNLYNLDTLERAVKANIDLLLLLKLLLLLGMDREVLGLLIWACMCYSCYDCVNLGGDLSFCDNPGLLVPVGLGLLSEVILNLLPRQHTYDLKENYGREY